MLLSRILMEYCINAVWLAPVVAGAAWLLVKLAGPRPKGEHWVWLGALAVCVALPGIGIRPEPLEPLARFGALPSAVESPRQEATLEPIRLESLPSSTSEPARSAAEAASSTAWFERRVHEVAIPPRVAGWFGWVYAGVVGLGALRLLRDWRAASTLVREASPYAFTEADAALLDGLAETFRLSVPRVLRSERVRSPVVVGALRPRLLLPAGFATCSEAERRAALCHEFAHLRRRDCLVHAGVQTLMLPLIWHPAAHFAGRRIARSREMACDAMAAAAMNPEADGLTYARCLLNLARKMVGRENEALGLGLLRTNKLEERVMRLTEVKRVATMRERLVRRVGGIAVAGAVLAAGALVHVAPVVAQESGSSTPATVSQRPPVPPVAATPAAPISIAPAPSVAEGSSFGLGTSGTESDSAELPKGVYQDDGGEHAMVKDGSNVHRWVSADGTKYMVRDGQAAPYTKAQERAAEAEYKQRMAQAQAAVAKVTKKLNSPEFKAQIDRLSSAATAEAMTKAQGALAEAGRNFDSPEFKSELAQLNSPEFKTQMDAQMEELKQQLAQLDTKEFRDSVGKLTSAELAAQLALAEKQAALADTPEMQRKLDDAAKRLDEASARLDAAAKALAEAQKRLQETTPK